VRLLTVVVEGDHDVVFVERTLRSRCGYAPYTARLEDYPRPLGGGATSLLLSFVRRTAQQSLPLSEAKMVPRPGVDVALQHTDGQTLALVFNTHGVERDLQFVRDLHELLSASPRLNAFRTADFLFLADADTVGAAGRAARLVEVVGGVVGVSSLAHRAWTQGTLGEVGLYVFAAPDRDAGALEDHLWPMVQQCRPEAFAAAQAYIDGCDPPESLLRGNATRRAKAIITSAGQFAFPGQPMAKMIRHDALSSELFRDAPVVVDFADFLSRA